MQTCNYYCFCNLTAHHDDSHLSTSHGGFATPVNFKVFMGKVTEFVAHGECVQSDRSYKESVGSASGEMSGAAGSVVETHFASYPHGTCQSTKGAVGHTSY